MELTGTASALWWIGIAILFLVVIPLVVVLAHGLLRTVREIKLYANDVNAQVAKVASNVSAVPALAETQELVAKLGPALIGAAGLLKEPSP